MRRHALPLVALVFAGPMFDSGCGDGGGMEPAEVVVLVTPPSSTVLLDQQLSFQAMSLNGSLMDDVVWNVDEGQDWGTISEDGVYTAPPAIPIPAVATIRARSSSSPSSTATASVSLVDPADLK